MGTSLVLPRLINTVTSPAEVAEDRLGDRQYTTSPRAGLPLAARMSDIIAHAGDDGGGMFVTIDGPSGVGKTTVSKLVVARLRVHGHAVLLTTTPSESELGRLARARTYQLRGMSLSCLVAADRHHHDLNVVRPALAAGMVVVCDRYVPSSLVLDVLDGVDPSVIPSLYNGITMPDVAFVLNGDPAVCAERAKIRGTYSRLHAASADDTRREAALFDVVGAQLAELGYRVYGHDIGQHHAEVVAEALTGVLLDTKDGAS